MKQIKLSPYEAVMILSILSEVDSREVFRNDPNGSLIHHENMTRNMILTLRQLLEPFQNKKGVSK